MPVSRAVWDGKTARACRSAMLTACLKFSASCSQACKPQCAQCQDLVLENLLLPHQLGRAHPADSTPIAYSASPLGQAALASSGPASDLALAVSLPRRTPLSQSRGARPDRDHVPRQPAVGQRADQGRVAQAGHRGQQSLDSTLWLARTGPRANADLAHLPAQPCSSYVGGPIC
jgi:hypothetical protein